MTNREFGIKVIDKAQYGLPLSVVRNGNLLYFYSAKEGKDEKIKAMRSICEKYTPDKMKYFDSAINAGLNRTNVYKMKIENITAKRKKYDSQGVEMKWARME